MKKKLQVFISSTFTDLVEERQAAVEAILSSGHIPAGMELFKAGDETQKETIKKWINESDVYLLLLGGRYGSIEPKSGISYTQWEYDYAGNIGKPRFSLVMTEEYLDKKVKEKGSSVLETSNTSLLTQFKNDVLGKTSEFFDDVKDIKLSIVRKMVEFQANENLVGWISGNDIESTEKLANLVANLTTENLKLKQEIESLIENKKEKTVLSNFNGNSKTSDEEFDYFTEINFYERLDRVFKLKNAEKITSDAFRPRTISWVDDDDDEKEYTLEFPNGELSPYFVYINKTDDIDKLYIIAKITQNYDYNSALGDIRVTLSEYDVENDMNIKFLITHPANQPNKKDYALKFFEKAKEQIKNKAKFELELWDEQTLIEIEKELLLRL